MVSLLHYYAHCKQLRVYIHALIRWEQTALVT